MLLFRAAWSIGRLFGAWREALRDNGPGCRHITAAGHADDHADLVQRDRAAGLDKPVLPDSLQRAQAVGGRPDAATRTADGPFLNSVTGALAVSFGDLRGGLARCAGRDRIARDRVGRGRIGACIDFRTSSHLLLTAFQGWNAFVTPRIDGRSSG